MDQPKLGRLLRLMKMLTANSIYSVDDLAQRLETTTRTIYRYIDSFREAGFVVKKNGGIYQIDKSSDYFRDISSLVHFTEEEAWVLKNAIESIDETHLIKQNLKKKLYTVYNYRILAETVTHGQNAININRLTEAIEEKKQVILSGYSSANSRAVSNRLVEAFAFTTNYIQIWAWEPASQSNKLFKVSRIGEVIVMPDAWQHEHLHKAGLMDCFRMSSTTLIPVKLQLGLRAATLLTEEYPLAGQFLTRHTDNQWTFEGNVCGYEGIGRFVLGLCDDIRVLEDEGLKNFLTLKIKSIHDCLAT